MYKEIIVLMALVVCTVSNAQNVLGTILSKGGERIPFATIQVLNTSKGTQADENGTFTLKLRPGDYQISIHALGYARVIKNVSVTDIQNTDIVVVLIKKLEALNEVVISAERRETVLQRTPVAVTVLGVKNLEEYRAWSFSDISALAPSLQTIEHGGSTSTLFINIRGVMGLHSQSAVATYVDGVYQFESFSVPLTFNNVERIEILRGPQGTLYGRNAFGGVLNITTKQPTNTPKGHVEIGVGNYEQQRYTASYSTPLIKDKLFIGISGLFNQHSGIYRNTVTGNDFDRPQSISGAVNIKYLASDKWDFTFNGRFERNEDEGSYPWVSSDSLLFAEPYTVARNSRNIELRKNYNASVKADHYGNTFDFHSITAIQHYQRGFPELLDVDFTGEDLRKIQNNWDVSTITQEFRVSSKQRSGKKLSYTLGSYLWIAPEGINDNVLFTNEESETTASTRYSIFNNRGLAFFGQGTYTFDKKLSATLGLRYDVENRKLSQERRVIQIDGSSAITNPLTDFKNSFDALTPKVILSYQATRNILIYSQYARGFRAGGLNAFAPNDADIPFDEEYSNNYEIGIKNTLLDNKLRINLTGFYLQQRDQQVTVIEDAFFLTRNTGDMNNLGAELEVEALPLKRLKLQWTTSVSDAEYENLTVFSGGENKDFSGNKPLFNPNFVSFTALQYIKEFKNNITAFVRGEHRYTAAHFFNFDNVIRQSPYSMYNARVGVRYKYYELALWGRNLTDVTYRTWATRVFLLNQPKMYGITLSADF